MKTYEEKAQIAHIAYEQIVSVMKDLEKKYEISFHWDECITVEDEFFQFYDHKFSPTPWKDWTIVESPSGYCKNGFPVGKIICKDPENVEQVIKDHNIENPIITKYEERK